MSDEPERRPWERLPGEPSGWYLRFSQFYLGQTGGVRSLLGAYKAERDSQGRKRSDDVPTSWRRAAARWEWRKRGEAWDAEQAAQSVREWEARKAEQREKEWGAAGKLLDKALQMLQFPLAQVERVEGADGSVRTTIRPAEWRMADAAKLADTAAKLARLAAGMETNRERVELTWQTEVIDLIRGGEATFDDVTSEFGPELADTLFRAAGVPVLSAAARPDPDDADEAAE